jgi:hypothetical protein
MRILYISKAESADFLCDTLFHGLRTILGPDVVDVERLWFAYKSGFPDGIPWHTFYGLLPDIDVDRTDIEKKIRARYFDYIIYGSIHRWRKYLDLACKVYHKSRIIFIDGEDDHDLMAFDRIEPQNWEWGPEGYRASVPYGHLYFKRELSSPSLAIPIQFSIPKEQIWDLQKKIRLMAPNDPRDKKTYNYPVQKDYFQQYAESCYGVTMKKGGWDCARHYEIMAAGSIPYFIGLEDCPVGTMTKLPKDDLKEARLACDLSGGQFSYVDPIRYQQLSEGIRKNLLENLTTEAMAKYVLERIQQ